MTTKTLLMNSYEKKHKARRDIYLQRAALMASVIPFGQPIMCSSHEQHDRKYRNSIKAFQELGYSEEEIKELFTPNCSGSIGTKAASLIKKLITAAGSFLMVSRTKK